MVSGKRKKHREHLLNPTRRVNWPTDPETEEELLIWMESIKQTLLNWMNEAKARAEDQDVKGVINSVTKSTQKTWEPFKDQIDVQTGSIFDTAEQRRMDTAMRASKVIEENIHKTHGTWYKSREYMYAQAAWEDFLYYQNVWNRRGLIPDRQYSETPAEKATVVSPARQSRQTRGKKGRSFVILTPSLGTPGAKSFGRFDGSPYNQPFLDWIEHIVGLFRRYNVGYRKRAPPIVGPTNAHRYSQPPRGTTPQILSNCRKRLRHLEEKFPRKRRALVDQNEKEEDRCTEEQRAENDKQEREGNMQAIVWSLDPSVCQAEKQRRQTESGYDRNVRTRKLLPTKHETHHSCREISSDWPTSYESQTSASTISRTIVRRVPAYEMEKNTENDGADEKQAKDSDTPRYKRDDAGNPIPKMTSGRHKRQAVKNEGRVFEYDTHSDGTILGRGRGGDWQGSWENRVVNEEEWELDAELQRIPETPLPAQTNIFTTVVLAKGGRAARAERNRTAGVTNQLSDDEDEAQTKPSTNYRLSGNANPTQVGNPTNTGTGGDLNDDEESDDENDLFRKAYEEASGTGEDPILRRARELFAEMVAESGTMAAVRCKRLSLGCAEVSRKT
ncbi:hypothetical protein EK21DRAFT_52110 [Setomelanomma holmii]|uniref:Uncharacterized protein n=1 Tax=Setomelanomma holmii TaxID=210430 RepID=A0A9P4HMX4_9PLEO|nr:hypothetical protein EK21DRAFT_52110 [Setomelanomma holmii]